MASIKEQDQNVEQIFKTCPMCAKKWRCRDDFLDDPELIFNGYQANLGIVEQGLFYFTHEHPACGSTMILKAEMFLSLFTGKSYPLKKQLTEECPGKCFNRLDLSRCEVQCEFAFVREVSQIIKDRSQRVA